MADRAEPEGLQRPADAPKAAVPLERQPPSTPEISAPMLDVHAPHHANTWRDFFIHIATICVGLLIAVTLEQTVEAVHHHQQRKQLLVSLDHDTRATLRDADFAAGERLRRMQWNEARIEQVQAALASHTPLAPAAPQKSAFITVPADPAWEA